MTATAISFDWDVLRSICSLESSENPKDRERTIQLLDQLSNCPQGWQICASALSSNDEVANGQWKGAEEDPSVKFFCCRVIEGYLKTSYANSNSDDKQSMRGFLSSWLQKLVCKQTGSVEEPVYIRNKAAQIFTYVFLIDYPRNWPSFFGDLLEFVNDAILKEGFASPTAVCSIDVFLRVLISIYPEIVTRDCPIELARNTTIKDSMRDNDVNRLVESWFYILEQSVSAGTDNVTKLILKVVSLYISWIEVTLVANRRFLDVFFQLLAPGRPVPLRRKVLTCLRSICQKGMQPACKLDLIQWLSGELDAAGVWLVASQEENTDYLERLGELVYTMGVQLIEVYTRFTKEEFHLGKADTALHSLEHEVDLAFPFLDHVDNDVSNAVSPLVHDYITLLKTIAASSPVNNNTTTKSPAKSTWMREDQRIRVRQMLHSVVNKMKYGKDYNFDKEGEDEVTFQEYRSELRTIVSNLAQLDADLVLGYTQDLLRQMLANWQQTPLPEVEVALALFYHLGEAIKPQKGDFFTKGYPHREAMQQLMSMVCSSQVSLFQHSAVQLQYFECVVRYEKYFNYNTELISNVLVEDYIEVILREISDLLSLPTTQTPHNNGKGSPLSQLEVSYVYETAAQLIVVGSPDKLDKLTLFRTLHQPIHSRYPQLVNRLRNLEDSGDPRVVNNIAQSIKDSVDLLSRTSRPFNTNQSMQWCGCVPAFRDALGVLITSLDQLPISCPGRPLVCVGVRAFLHRMIICMDDSTPTDPALPDSSLLSLLPHAILLLIRGPQSGSTIEQQSDVCRDLRDLLPLINQLLSRYKNRSLFVTQEVLPSLLSNILCVLRIPPEEHNMDAAEELKLLRRAYLQLISNLISQLPEALTSLDPQALEEVLASVINECLQCSEIEPQAVKICFLGFRQMVLAWGNDPSFLEQVLLPRVVPALFLTPAKPGFDLKDAQFSLALKEAANCHRAFMQKQGESYADFLRLSFLPSLGLQSSASEDFIKELRGSQNDFQIYLNRFYTNAKAASS